MGGADDFLISLYRINVKTKKRPERISVHFFDFELTNACIKHRDIHQTYGTPKKKFRFNWISRKCRRVLDKSIVVSKVVVHKMM